MSTEINKDFVITDELRKWADEEVPEIEISRETGKFVDHHLSRGNRYKNWDAAWRNWMRKAPEWGGYRKATGSRGMPKEITEEERAYDKRRFKEDMKKLEVVK